MAPNHDDYASRLSTLEAFGKVNSTAIAELRRDIRTIANGVEEIRRDIHGARIAGRVGLGIAMLLGGFIAWITQVFVQL